MKFAFVCLFCFDAMIRKVNWEELAQFPTTYQGRCCEWSFSHLFKIVCLLVTRKRYPATLMTQDDYIKNITWWWNTLCLSVCLECLCKSISTMLENLLKDIIIKFIFRSRGHIICNLCDLATYDCFRFKFLPLIDFCNFITTE